MLQGPKMMVVVAAVDEEDMVAEEVGLKKSCVVACAKSIRRWLWRERWRWVWWWRLRR